VRINFIPRDGGNRFSGTIAGNIATDGMQPDTFVDVTEAQRHSPIFRASTVKRNGEFNPGLGGPLVKDKLLVLPVGRYQAANTYVTGMFHNKNAGNPNAWTYDPDPTRPATFKSRLARLSGTRHVAGGAEAQGRHHLRHRRTRARATPASARRPRPRQAANSTSRCNGSSRWTGTPPVTNRLLVEAERHSPRRAVGHVPPPVRAGDVTIPDARIIGVNEQTRA
jgi:hypothetical protein